MKFVHIMVPQGFSAQQMSQSGGSSKPGESGQKQRFKVEKLFEEFLQKLYNTLPHAKMSFEFFGKGQYTFLFMACEEEDYSTIESLIYSVYPGCEIKQASDYVNSESERKFKGGHMTLRRSDVYPFKSYTNFEGDSQNSLFSYVAKLKSNEETWVQFVISPKRDSAFFHWIRRVRAWGAKIREFFSIKDRIKKVGDQSLQQLRRGEAKEKQVFDHFRVTMRLAFMGGEDDINVKHKYAGLFGTFSSFQYTDVNEFKTFGETKNKTFLKTYQLRKHGKGSVLLSLRELATLFHLPNSESTPHIVHMQAKRGEPPDDLPTEGPPTNSLFGTTNYHGSSMPFGIRRKDRMRHLYTVGKSGSGKSKLLELFIADDLKSGQGIGVLDPHGDLVDDILKYVPKERIKDVVIFDPSDTEFPIGFNPLENVGEDYKMQVTIGFIQIFKKLFGNNWSYRLEHVFRYVTLALLDSPNTTVLSILKMLTDKNYRQKIVARINDSVVKNFWVNEFAGWSEKFDAEAITPLLNKIGQLVSTNMIRNIIAQPDNKFDIRQMMDEGKILLIKVSKGLLGEENSQVLGAMMITKIYQAAMQRADTASDKRRDFYLYVDEFQNFATDTFAEIMSEARKYGLCLTIAHQYMGQLNDEIRKTVFGNVGSFISFRVGAEDAKILAAEYTPRFNERDIINLGMREFYTKMTIDGELREPFSGRTLNVVAPKEDYSKEIIENSRKEYCIPRSEVEEMLTHWDEEASKVDEEAAKMFEEEQFEEPVI